MKRLFRLRKESLLGYLDTEFGSNLEAMARYSEIYYTSLQSRRLSGWNYANSGYYFVTICTKGKERYFGNISHGKMILSEIGRIVVKNWFELPVHAKTVKIDAFICMPDHVHGIIGIINDDNDVITYSIAQNIARNVACNVACNVECNVECSVAACCDATGNKPNHKSNAMYDAKQNATMVSGNVDIPINSDVLRHGVVPSNNIYPNSLPAIIRSFKSACTKHVNRQFPNVGFKWQPRYYDRIIRDEKALESIRKYIHDNPAMYPIP